MPRLVRRKTILQRLQATLNPLDFWLWLSEEIETREWDTKSVANSFGAVLHVFFLIARANSGPGRGKARVDDVFGELDERKGKGWLGWLATLIVIVLTWLSVLNAAFTFLRKRHYRLFESNIDETPSTPSAHRVRVSSSPVSSSPLRFLTQILAAETNPLSRTHPDPTLDVWELAVWDPLPLSLRLFCLFSPGHVLFYWLFLPLSPLDPRPSTTVVTTILLEVLLSVQLLWLQTKFSQQTKDTAIIHKEVLNEYDIKYVHPQLHPTVRDVGIQFSGPDAEPWSRASWGRSHHPHSRASNEEPENEITTYTPTTIVRRGFKTNPNPNFARHISPDEPNAVPKRETVHSPNPLFKTPSAPNIHSYDGHPHQQLSNVRESSPLKNMHYGGASTTAIRQPQFRSNTSTGISTSTSTSSGNDGGSLGIYSHANSPLKKASSMYDIQHHQHRGGGSSSSFSSHLPRNSFQAARREIAEDRERERSRSPAKRLPPGGAGYVAGSSGLSGNGRRTSGPPGFGAGGGDGSRDGYGFGLSKGRGYF